MWGKFLNGLSKVAKKIGDNKEPPVENKFKSLMNKKFTGAAKKKVIAVATVLIGKMILIILIVSVILSPLALTFAFFTNLFRDLENSYLKLGTNLSNAFVEWLPIDKEDAKADNYEDYLVKRFLDLNDKLSTGDFEDDEVGQLQQAAVGWVYGKIFKDYFEPSLLQSVFGNGAGWGADIKAPVLKPLAETASTVYVPVHEKDIATARKEIQGDDINAYDIQALDFVAGTLFDLMDLNLKTLEERFIAEEGDKFKEKVDNAKLEVYQKQGGKLLSSYGSHIFKILHEAGPTYKGGMSAKLKELGLDYNSLQKNAKSISNLYNFIKTNKRFSSSEDIKWLLDSLGKLDEETLEANNLETIGKEIIKSQSDYNRLCKVTNELNNMLKQYLNTFSTTDENSKTILEYFAELSKNRDFATYAEESKKETLEKAREEANKITKDVVEFKLEEYLRKEIKELNLSRTQLAAETYANALIELEPKTEVTYYAMNLDHEYFKKFFELKDYSNLKIKKNGAKIKVDNFTEGTLFMDSTKKLKGDSDFVNNFYFDANSNPIIAGIDNTVGTDYMMQFKAAVIGAMIERVQEAKDDLDMRLEPYFRLFEEDLNILNITKDMYLEEIKKYKGDIKGNHMYRTVYAEENADLESIIAEFKPINMEAVDDEMYPYGKPEVNYAYGVIETFFEEVNSPQNGLSSDIWTWLMNGEESIEENLHQTEDWLSRFNNRLLSKNKSTIASEYLYRYNNAWLNIEEPASIFKVLQDEINRLNGKSDAKRSKYLAELEENLTKSYNEEVAKLDAIMADLEKLKDEVFNPDSVGEGGVFVLADLSTVYSPDNPDGQNNTTDARKPYIKGENNSTLVIMEYKNTVEDAIKKVATTHYSDVLSRLKSSTGGGVGPVVDIGDIAIGSWTIEGSEGYGRYAGAMQHFSIIEKVCRENDFDPYLIVALIAVESSGNLNPSNSSAAGLTQIEHVHWGNTVTLPNGESITLDPAKLNTDAELAVKAAVWQLNNRMSENYGNLLVGLGGYNFGPGGVKRVILHYLDSIGKASLASWTNPNGSPDAASSQALTDYIKSGDTGWLSSRMWYSTPGFLSEIKDLNYVNNPLGWQFFAGVGADYNGGDPTYIDKVLKLYNTSKGMPWYKNSETGDIVQLMSGSTASMPSEDGETVSYHKNGELVLWEEYYSSNGILDTADANAVKFNNENTLLGDLNRTPYSENLVKAINSVFTSYSDKITGIGISEIEFKALVAGVLNYKYDMLIKPPTYANIETIVKGIVDDYISIIEQLNGKDKYFATYIYLADGEENKEMAMVEVSATDSTFKDFAKEKYESDATSITSQDSSIKKVAQVISGDKNVDVKNFYSILDKINTETTTFVNPLDEFYKQWFEAKYTMHEMYNVLADDTAAETGKTYEKLPVKQWTGGSNSSTPILDKDVEGMLTVDGDDPYIVYQSLYIRKKFLEKNVDTSKTRNKSDIKYIVIHDTNKRESTENAAKQHENMSNNSSAEIVHYVVDGKEAYHYVQNDVVANHITDSEKISEGNYPEVNNSNSIGIQFTVGVTDDKNKRFWNLVALTKYLMDEYNISAENVILHSDVTNADCSNFMLTEREQWTKFKDVIASPKVKVTFTKNVMSKPSDQAMMAAKLAIQAVGKPYKKGGLGPNEFDNAGLIHYIYSHNDVGVDMPTTLSAQLKIGTDVFKNDEAVSSSKIMVGDLIYFGNYDNPTHVGVWIGNGQYVYAPTSGEGSVTKSSDLTGAVRVKRVVAAFGQSGEGVFYSQHDSRWASKVYSAGETISQAGCGPTSTAMVLSYLGANVSAFDTNNDGVATPDEMVAFSVKNNMDAYYNGEFVGTSYGYYPLVAKAAGLELTETTDINVAKQALREGKKIVGSYDPGHWIPYGGHLIAIVGISDNNQMIVHDPNLNTLEDTRNGRYNGANPDANMVSGLKKFFIFG